MVFRDGVAAIILGGALAAAAPGGFADEASRTAVDQRRVLVAYHFDAGSAQVLPGLRNIRNHLAADPSASIAVVALADGIDFLLEGAETEGGYPFNILVEELQQAGVRFKVCNNTLKARNLSPDRVLEGVEIVESGVAELARLQATEGYAYIKP